MRSVWISIGIGIFCIFSIVGCAKVPISNEVTAARPSSPQLAKNASWAEEIILPKRLSGFEIYSLHNLKKPSDGILNIYIEGDGHVWDRGLPSDNPTPLRAIALEMALQQPMGAIAYLARPCQFIGVGKNPNCIPISWTDQRYSSEVIADLNQAVEFLKIKAGAQQIRLIGYSGGGAISLLIAMNRSDVIGVVTVAGNLDTEAWVSYHRLPPLRGSLNPAAYIRQIQGLPQIHFVGTQDEIVPPSLTQDFVKRYASMMPAQIITVPKNGHACCWVERWSDLWTQVVKE